MADRLALSAAVLCGGAGRRLGRTDKGQLTANGRTFLECVVEALAPLTHDLMLVTRHATQPHPAAARLVLDEFDDAGALGAIVTALHAGTADRVVIVACDMPFVTTPFLQYLVDQQGDADASVARDAEGRYALCGVFDRRIAPRLRACVADGRLRVEDALATIDVRDVEASALDRFAQGQQLLININTPDDYRMAVGGSRQGAVFP